MNNKSECGCASLNNNKTMKSYITPTIKTIELGAQLMLDSSIDNGGGNRNGGNDYIGGGGSGSGSSGGGGNWGDLWGVGDPD